MTRLRNRSDKLAIAALALVLAGCFYRVVFLGGSLAYSDNFNPFDYRPSVDNYGPNSLPARAWTSSGLSPTANLHDPGAMFAQWEPDSIFFRHSILSGEIPLWNPYAGGGTPFLANPISTPLFPPYLLMVLLGGTSLLRTVYDLAILFSAGAFTFLLLRRHGLGHPAALLGGIAFMLSGALVTNAGSYVGHGAALFPAALLATRWHLDDPSWRKTGTLAIIFSAIALCSYPPILFGGFGLVAFYGLVVSLFDSDRHRARVSRMFRFSAAAVLGVGLVTFFYLPVFQQIRSTPQFSEAYRGAGLEALPWTCALELVSHVLLGAREIFSKPPLADPFSLHLPYVGVVVLFLAGCAGKTGDRKGSLLLGVVAAGTLAALMKLFGVPPVQWIGRIPVLANIHFAAYLGAVLNFLLALLAAIGLERLARKRVSLFQVLAACLIPALMLGLLRGLAFRDGLVPGPAADLWEYRYWVLVWLLIATGFAAIAVTRVPIAQLAHAGIGVILALTAAEAFLNTDYPRQDRFNVWEHPPEFVRILPRRESSDRVFTADGAMMANANDALGIASLDSLYQFNPARSYTIYKRYANPGAAAFLREAVRLPPEGILDRASVGFVTCRSGGSFERQSAARGYGRIFDDGFTVVFRRPAPPRYFFTSHYRVAPAGRLLAQIAERPREREILLEEQPRWDPAMTTSGTVEIRRSRANTLELEVEAPRPGFLYAAENADAGWKATVNGRPARIWNANYAFRAVEVPAGKSVVRFSYWPPGLTAGLTISAVSVVALLGLLRIKGPRPASGA